MDGDRNVDIAEARAHETAIRRVLDGDAIVPSDDLSTSWRRSALEFRVDPDDRSAPQVLTEREIAARSAPLDHLIMLAREEIDRLHSIVGQAGYVVLLCDPDGVAIHHRGNEALADEFKHWGVWLGGVWSEHTEGTNGIGTAITDHRPTSVHRQKHFRTRHIGLSCAGAPICDACGKLVAVLDSSSIDASVSEHAHGLALAATVAAAREIEERLFRDAFRRYWIVVAKPRDQLTAPVLMAVDRTYHVIGANHHARARFELSDADLARGIPLTTLFAQPLPPLKGATGEAAVQLMRDDEPWLALFTQPCPVIGVSSFHTRPRHTLLDGVLVSMVVQRGGLAPAVLRRVEQFVEAHLDTKITLELLATIAGLSVHHFARMFRQSTGDTPHEYVLRRRVERAQMLLRESTTPLSMIATAVGFADHSHFTRHFRRFTGTTPAEARRLGAQTVR